MKHKLTYQMILKKTMSVMFVTVMIIASFLIIEKPKNISASTISGINATGYHHTGRAVDPNNPFVTQWFDNWSIDQLVVDGNVGTCVQPWKTVSDIGNYTATPANNIYLTKLQYHSWDKLSSKSMYDYAVWQLMVWEYYGYAPSHDVPNYTARKAEIVNEMNNHENKASWNNQTITLNKGETKTINDTNGVVASMAQIGSLSGVSIIRSGNVITLKNEGGETSGSVKFNRYHTTGTSGIIYVHPSSQDIGFYPLSDPNSSVLNIRTSSGRISIQKTGNVFSDISETIVDDITYKLPTFDQQSLADAEFTITADGQINDHSGNKLYDDGDVVEVITTDATGVATSNDLPEGKYKFEETKAPVGYNRDETVYTHTVTADGGGAQIITQAIENIKKPLFYTIHKTLEENPVAGLHNSEAYKNVEFTIYAADMIHNYNQSVSIETDTPITTFGIDADGHMVTRTIDDTTGEQVETPFELNLPYGKYYVQETKTDDSYVLDDTKYPFTISADTDTDDILVAINDGEEILNKLKEYKVIVNKIDIQTKKPIISSDFLFEAKLYDAEGTLVETVEASADTITGSATFKVKGQVAKVVITEIKAPKGYILSKEEKTFAIDNESEETLFDENLVYSFEYMNTPLPDDVRTGDTSNTSELLAILGSSFLALTVGIAFHFRKKKVSNS